MRQETKLLVGPTTDEQLILPLVRYWVCVVPLESFVFIFGQATFLGLVVADLTGPTAQARLLLQDSYGYINPNSNWEDLLTQWTFAG